jgi:type III restriction enzyme
MLNNILNIKKNQWLQSKDCSVIELINYIKNAGKLRDTQIEAIETYLFLKIQGENNPLWQLFSEGFFNTGTDLAQYNLLHPIAANFLAQNKQAYALFYFASQKHGSTADLKIKQGNSLLPELAQLILKEHQSLDYDNIIKNLFYNVNYPDYLMSLPMGAGKTYLMAAFMYLDLYYAGNEPDNKTFAHNFLVLIPSGLKLSIVPSLKTIEKFDPSWVLPEPAASKLKKLLQFDVLDESKSAKKSNKARNPNSQKVQACFPNPFGRVFVVNAEKVILDRVDLNTNAQLIEKTDDEKAKFANELRHLIGEIPNLSILIDEVHHAATDDIKLRQVVNNWYNGGNITTVLGFSGTPYLQKADKIKLTETDSIKLTQITNTVYYYPLLTAVKEFLKTPTVKTGQNLDRFQIIKQGIEDFDSRYKNKIYANGTIAKLAIYCSNIEVLREEILPFLTGDLNINPDEILEFHGGNKYYSLPKENELEFRSLDLPLSKKRYIILVQVGKEGWDCPSLTGVILSQKGDSPQNMVLQTACRCLRQVDKNTDETALIWLNQDNADTLNKQLKQEQNTSIEELNNARRGGQPETVERFSRTEHLQLPDIEFYQLKVTYQAIDEEQHANTRAKLIDLLETLDDYKTAALISTSGINNIDTGAIDIVNETGLQFAHYQQWLFAITRASFGTLTIKQLHEFDSELTPIFERITYQQNEQRFFNELYDLHSIHAKIRVSFVIKRHTKTATEIIPQSANLLIVKNLAAVEKHDKLYPNEQDSNKIRELDNSNKALDIDLTEVQRAYDTMKQSFEAQGIGDITPPFEDFYKAHFDVAPAVKYKEGTFHYLPYDFKQSNFELTILKKALELNDFKTKGLEIYYNGERGLTEFVINCFAKEGNYWKNIGKYTTDFLIVQRTAKNTLHKALILETKGAGYSNDPVFQRKRKFVETDFIKLNKEKFSYSRFDFLYLEDSDDISTNTVKLGNKINQFFNEIT